MTVQMTGRGAAGSMTPAAKNPAQTGPWYKNLWNKNLIRWPFYAVGTIVALIIIGVIVWHGGKWIYNATIGGPAMASVSSVDMDPGKTMVKNGIPGTKYNATKDLFIFDPTSPKEIAAAKKLVKNGDAHYFLNYFPEAIDVRVDNLPQFKQKTSALLGLTINHLEALASYIKTRTDSKHLNDIDAEGLHDYAMKIANIIVEVSDSGSKAGKEALADFKSNFSKRLRDVELVQNGMRRDFYASSEIPVLIAKVASGATWAEKQRIFAVEPDGKGGYTFTADGSTQAQIRKGIIITPEMTGLGSSSNAYFTAPMPLRSPGGNGSNSFKLFAVYGIGLDTPLKTTVTGAINGINCSATGYIYKAKAVTDPILRTSKDAIRKVAEAMKIKNQRYGLKIAQKII